MLRGAATLFVSALLANAATAWAEEPLRLKLDPVCVKCAATEAILAVQINLQAKGDYLVLVSPDGDVLLREQDLAELGLTGLPGTRSRIDGVEYVSLRSLPGFTYELDAERLVLAVRADPRYLAGRQVVDLGPRRSAEVLRPRPAGAFFNYNFTHTRTEGLRDARDAAGELGLRFGEYLLASDGYSFEDPSSGERRHVRLSTSLTRDRRDSLQRLTLGDFLTVQPGPLGSSLRLGGLSVSRRFSIDPYYVRFPGQVVAGTAALPSEVFVYSNGVLVRRERIAPGGFELQNLVNAPGLQSTEVVVRDVLGNEQRIVDPFYYSDSLLRPGLDEYSFDAGVERRQFGVRSADYGKPGFAAFYRRGLTPGITLGAHAEALDGRYTVAPTATLGIGTLGVTSLSVGTGRGARGSGQAFSVAHAFHSPRWSANAALRMEERDFGRASPEVAGTRRYDFAAALSYALTAGSGISLAVTSVAPWEAPAARSTVLGYRMRATRDVYLSATARHVSGAQRFDELVLTLSWHFDAGGRRHLASFQGQRSGDDSGALLQLSGGNPEGEGFVYRANAETRDEAGGSRRLLNPAAQWNAAHAVLRAEAFHDSATASDRTQLAVQGGIAAVGGEWALSRPIADSFAIVKVGSVPGVRVYANNQPVGTTDASGTVFVPRLASYFENPVAIEDRDLPFNYLVPQARFIVSPALRSGVLLDFEARAVSAVAGRLMVRAGQPFADAQGEVAVGGERRELLTARDGSFYLEQMGPGRYEGEAARAGALCRFALEVPASEDPVTDLGEVRCE
ncbi:MAG TPA: fimbria/pilus outer membrane usher protein [Burkholderiales bacterium]